MNDLDSSTSDPELRPDPLSGYDAIGTVFLQDRRVLRGIRANKIEAVHRLLESGLIRRLEQERLFPATSITQDVLPGFGLTLEHERLHPLVFAGEWSFDMLRDSALALLEVNRIARGFGYETKDAHLYNLCFVGTRPMFFDLGSFVPLGAPRSGWRGYEEFVRGALYPLSLARQAGAPLSRMLLDYGLERILSHEDFVRLRAGGLANWLPCRSIARARWLYGGFLALGWSEGRAARWLDQEGWRRSLRDRLQASPIFEFLTADFRRLQGRVRRLGRRRRWIDRRDWLGPRVEPAGDIELSPRARRICDLLTELHVESAIELGGGTGALALAIRMQGAARKVICTDADANAIDRAFDLFKRHGDEDCTAAVVDFFEDSRSIRMPSVAERYRADVVLALDLTHLLILRRGAQPALLMERIASFCSRYAMIEFLPRGLSDEKDGTSPPAWYTRAWFHRHFVTRFELLREESIPPDGILFIGRKRTAAAA